MATPNAPAPAPVAGLIVYAGQRVITAAGTVRTVAFVAPNGWVYGYSPRGGVEPIRAICEAWGEPCLGEGMPAA